MQFTFTAANSVNTSHYTLNRKFGAKCAATSRRMKKPVPGPPRDRTRTVQYNNPRKGLMMPNAGS